MSHPSTDREAELVFLVEQNFWPAENVWSSLILQVLIHFHFLQFKVYTRDWILVLTAALSIMFTELSITYGHCLKTLSTLKGFYLHNSGGWLCHSSQGKGETENPMCPGSRSMWVAVWAEPRLIATDAAMHDFIGCPCIIYSCCCFSPTGNQAQAGQEISFTAH